MTKIYTKTGDKGMTGTLRGRVSKSDCQTDALGTIDELNSWIGMCRREGSMSKVQSSISKVQQVMIEGELRRVQDNLLRIGSGMAGSQARIGAGEVKHLEKLIDRLTKDLPKLNNFIFPTGTGGAEYLQVARTVARRAEREMVKVAEDPRSKVQGSGTVMKYLNRLSDALFTMARWVNWKNGGSEEVWKI